MAGLFLAGPLYAADRPPEPPQSSNADVLDERVQKASRKELLSKEPTPPVLKVEEPEKRPPGDLVRKFFVREVLLKGNYSLPTSEWAEPLSRFRGREITLQEVQALATKIEADYRRRGYVTTVVYIPPQKLENKTLTIQVVEGKMGELIIEGNRWVSESRIRSRWNIPKGAPLQYKEMQAALRNLNRNPDCAVQAILFPGKETGTTDIHLKVRDRFPLHFGTSWDDYGVQSTGHKRTGLSLRWTDFLIPDASLLGGVILGAHFQATYGQYLVPLNRYGTSAIFGFSASQAKPSQSYKAQDIFGTSKTYSPGLRQLLYSSASLESYAEAGFDFKDSHTQDITGVRRKDRLRVPYADLSLRYLDRWGFAGGSQRFSFGVNGLGATSENNPYAGRAGAKPNFFKYEGNLTRSLVMRNKLQMLLKLNYQISPDKLLAQEELYLGGANTVRGYPEGDYLADQGLLSGVECRYPILSFFPGELKIKKFDFRKDIEGTAFVDYGYGQLRGASTSEVRSRSLLGAGGGVRIRVINNIFLRLEGGQALGDAPLTGSSRTRFHFLIQSET